MGMLFSYMPVSAAQMEELVANPERAADFLEEYDELGHDVDKAWHGLHFLLTGEAEGGDFPEAFILNGGRAISDEDVPMIRVFSAVEVKSIAKALEGRDWVSLAARFDPSAFSRANIYPDIWKGEDEVQEYLQENYEQLQRDIYKFASHDKCLLTCIG